VWVIPVFIVMIAATGCPVESDPLPIPPAPIILSSSLTPTVVAGQPITADVVTSHPFSAVSEMDIQVTGPGGGTLDHTGTHCYSELFFVPVTTSTRIDATTTESTLRCAMPAYATNGTWTATIWVYASGYETASVTTTFQVTGGTDGPSDPVITMITPPPSTATRGTSFPIEYRIDDVALGPNSLSEPVNFILLSSDRTSLIGDFDCTKPVTSQVTPSEVDIARTCTVGATVPTGIYTSYLSVDDQLGFRARNDFAVTVS
jgi:hypothetical protein